MQPHGRDRTGRAPCEARVEVSFHKAVNPKHEGGGYSAGMQIRVLGCSGAMAAGGRTTSFLIDHDLLVDAGTGVGDLTLDELVRIDDILVTHSHLDHVLAIGLLADSVSRRRRAAGRPAIRVHALAPTLAALRAHIFNDTIWPDFTRLPSPDRPVLSLLPCAIGQALHLGGRRVEVLPAEHSVPACGYAVWPPEASTAAAPQPGNASVARPRHGAWVFTGDTGPNPTLWSRLAQIDVAALVIETAFGDDEQGLADLSRHLSPARLREELAQLQAPADVYITHIKPGEVDAVMSAIGAWPSPHRIAALVSGQSIALGH